MKHSLILLILFSTICWGQGDAVDSDTDWLIRGHMNCTVKSQHIVEIADGITKEFTSFEGEFIVGDQLGNVG